MVVGAPGLAGKCDGAQMKSVIGFFVMLAGTYLLNMYFSLEQATAIMTFAIGCTLWLDGKIDAVKR
jgi:hypothetical protein